MTSEILMMNDTCVALAADSASIVGKKVFNADKIFELTRNQPIAVMVYGNSKISSVKVEVLVKEFRNNVDKKLFKTVRECADSFLKFIERGGVITCRKNRIITNDHVEVYLNRCYYQLWKRARDQFYGMLIERLSHKLEENSRYNINEIVFNEFGNLINTLENENPVENISEVRRIQKQISKLITPSITENKLHELKLDKRLVQYHDRMIGVLSSMISNRCL